MRRFFFWSWNMCKYFCFSYIFQYFLYLDVKTDHLKEKVRNWKYFKQKAVLCNKHVNFSDSQFPNLNSIIFGHSEASRSLDRFRVSPEGVKISLSSGLKNHSLFQRISPWHFECVFQFSKKKKTEWNDPKGKIWVQLVDASENPIISIGLVDNDSPIWILGFVMFKDFKYEISFLKNLKALFKRTTEMFTWNLNKTWIFLAKHVDNPLLLNYQRFSWSSWFVDASWFLKIRKSSFSYENIFF